MSNALFFALISLTAAGCLDVTFKRYSRKTRSRGMYVFACGLTWCAVQAVVFQIDGRAPVFDSTNVTYGLIAGILVVAANVILIEALTHLDISLGATIYRLNTIGVVILSFLFLSEDMGVLKLLGVGLGVFSILLLYGGAPHVASSRVAKLFIGAAIVASLCRAIFGVVSKSALQAGADADTLMLIAALSWVVGGLLYATVRERPFRITRQKAGYGLISGLLLATVANALIRALETGDASVVAPIANLSFIIALLISAAMGWERINSRKVAAMGLAAGSILLLAQAV